LGYQSSVPLNCGVVSLEFGPIALKTQFEHQHETVPIIVAKGLAEDLR
jgi:hypothetical protein